MRNKKAGWAVLLVAFTGCAENELTGRIFFEGKPVTRGTVQCVAAGGAMQTTVIAEDGTFLLKGVPAGPARFAVITLDAAKADPAFDAELDAKFAMIGEKRDPLIQDSANPFPIPEAYATIDTSDIRTDVGRGTTRFDIHLVKK